MQQDFVALCVIITIILIVLFTGFKLALLWAHQAADWTAFLSFQVTVRGLHLPAPCRPPPSRLAAAWGPTLCLLDSASGDSGFVVRGLNDNSGSDTGGMRSRLKRGSRQTPGKKGFHHPHTSLMPACLLTAVILNRIMTFVITPGSIIVMHQADLPPS